MTDNRYKCPKIKLCGLSSVSDIEVANALKPEFIGFVLWQKSKRNVGGRPSQKKAEITALFIDFQFYATAAFDGDLLHL